jgi:hypothetical protein
MAVLAGGWLVLDALRARHHLTEAGRLVSELRTQVERGDWAAAEQTLNDIREHAGAARERTRDPVWWLGERMPFVGDDLEGARRIAGALNGLTLRSVPELMDAAGSLDPSALAATAD